MRKCHAVKVIILILMCAGLAHAESWSQINQQPEISDGWQSHVSHSPFILGEEVAVATLEDGTVIHEISFGDYPRLDGSTVAVPMGLEIARQHLGLLESDLAGFVSFTTTHSAYENLITRSPGGAMTIYSRNAVMDETHPVDLLLATAPSDAELESAKAAGVTLAQFPVCYDAFIFIVHADNPVNSLTLAQIRDIYAGRIRNWQEVGGEDNYIFPYQREPNSGSQTAMEQLVMQGEKIERSGSAYTATDMSSLVEWFNLYDNGTRSIGYTYQYYLETLYTSETVKTLAIDGILPTPETLRDGTYPLSTNYFAVYRADDEDTPAGRMTEWLLSEAGQRAIAQAGYVPAMDFEEALP